MPACRLESQAVLHAGVATRICRHDSIARDIAALISAFSNCVCNRDAMAAARAEWRCVPWPERSARCSAAITYTCSAERKLSHFRSIKVYSPF